jgi:hypothetical protein
MRNDTKYELVSTDRCIRSRSVHRRNFGDFFLQTIMGLLLISFKLEKSKTHKLATYIVDQTAFLISEMVDVPLCPEMLEALDLFEQYVFICSCGAVVDPRSRKVDAIRRYMEQTRPAGKGFKALLGSKTGREISGLKAELENQLKALVCVDRFYSFYVHQLDGISTARSRRQISNIRCLPQRIHSGTYFPEHSRCRRYL